MFGDDEKASEGKEGKSNDAVQAEIDAAKAAMLTKPNKFVVFLVMFYAFLCMAIMYGAQQYTKAFGLSVCGLSGCRQQYDFHLYGLSVQYSSGHS